MTLVYKSPRTTFLLMALGLAGILTLFYFESIEPIRRQTRFTQSVRRDLESLFLKRPKDVTPKQWRGVVEWTLSAQVNCLRFQKSITREDMDRFERELTERVSGPVDLKTIDWIWDEIARISMHGKRYGETWRPTTPDRLAEFEKDDRPLVSTP